MHFIFPNSNLIHMHCCPSNRTWTTIIFVAECLSVRLLILQSMFSLGRVWPQLPSHIGMQLNVQFTKSSVHLRCFQCCSSTCGLIVATSKWQEIVTRASKKELEDWGRTEAKTESQNSPWSLWRDQWVWKRGVAASKAKKRMAILRNDHILTFGEVFETLLTSSNIQFAVFTVVILCCTWSTTFHAYQQ